MILTCLRIIDSNLLIDFRPGEGCGMILLKCGKQSKTKNDFTNLNIWNETDTDTFIINMDSFLIQNLPRFNKEFQWFSEYSL